MLSCEKINVENRKIIPVSVIVPCYNASNTVERAYDSVANQSVLPMEIIFVDDASADNNSTVNIIEKIKNNNNQCDVILIQQKDNKGPASARNIGWSFAKGDYVAFLDADDIWDEDKLLIQYSIMKKYNDVELSCHDIANIKNKHRNNFNGGFHDIKRIKELFKHTIFTSSVMIKNSSKRFDESQKLSEDFLLWIEILGNRGIYIDGVFAYNFKKMYGENGLSGKLWGMEKYELIALYKLWKRSLINPFIYILAAVFSVFKYMLRVLHVK
ncbi:MAG: glycosyltransferase family 2 protein [Selenomonas ruminantium]|uniref:Glycosyltransferase family 2 protein n=1 Tax=Selenomonas ruminantium TaxID=971 RepID=A0A927WGY8_SELRU|nr:glycosyltransferase family 2 protein [Selenomonas ruminantium]